VGFRCTMSLSDTIVPRLKKLLRHDAPPIPEEQFYNPDFAEHMADMIGIEKSSQRQLTAVGGPGALGLFLYEAFCKAQAELAKDKGNTSNGATVAAAKKG